MSEMDTCKAIQVIESTIQRRGEGIVSDPIRVIREYFLFDGTKIAEVDPVYQNSDGTVRRFNDREDGKKGP